MDFDLKKFAGAKHSGVIAKGEYPASVEKMEWVMSESGANMLVATIAIIFAHGGKKAVKDYFNLYHENPQVAEIAASRLADFVGACGLKEPPSDARVFEGMQCWVRIGIDKNGYNTIERYLYWKPSNNNAVLRANLAKQSEDMGEEDCSSKEGKKLYGGKEENPKEHWEDSSDDDDVVF